MAEIVWDKVTIAELETQVANGKLAHYAGYSSVDELYDSVEAMGVSPDADVRGYVKRILYWLDREKAYSFLVRSLRDPDEDVRYCTVQLIGSYGEKITPVLLPLLQSDSSPSVRCCAAAMLGYSGTPDAITALRQTAEHDHAMDFHGNRASDCAKDAILRIKARYLSGSIYDPHDVRCLADEQQILQQEDFE